MSDKIGSLVIELAADIARFREDMGKANRVAQDSARSIARNFDAMRDGAARAAAAVASIAGAASLGALVKSSIDAADNMSKMAQKVGVNIKELSGMAHAAELADVSTEALGKSMGKLNKAMYEAAGGKGPAETFEALGISVTDAAGNLRKADEMMVAIAGKFEGMDDGARKTALAMDLFGKSGADMIPLLNGGAAGLKEATDEAHRFGLVLDEEAGLRAEEFNDDLTRLKNITQGAALAFANEMLPSLLSVSDAMVNNGAGGAAIFGAAIKETVRDIQEATVYWAAFADKIGAWNDTDGLLGHMFSSKKAAEYKKRMEAIAEAEMGQLAAIAAGYDRVPTARPSGPGKAGSDSGGGGGGGGKPTRAGAWTEAGLSNLEASRVARAAEAQKILNIEIREQNRLLEESVKDWSLAGLAQGLEPAGVLSWKPKAPVFSLTGAASSFNQMGPTAEDLDQIHQAATTLNADYLEMHRILANTQPIDGAAAALSDYTETAKRASDDIYAAVTGGLQGMEDAMVDFAMTGKMSFKDMANSMIADMVRIAYRQSITGPLANAVAWGLNYFQSSDMTAPGAGPQLPSYDVGTPYVPRTGLALIHEGEAVIPAAKNRAGFGGGNVQVNVINPPGEKNEVTSRNVRFDGEQMIVDVVLKKYKSDPGFRAALSGGNF